MDILQILQILIFIFLLASLYKKLTWVTCGLLILLLLRIIQVFHLPIHALVGNLFVFMLCVLYAQLGFFHWISVGFTGVFLLGVYETYDRYSIFDSLLGISFIVLLGYLVYIAIGKWYFI